MIILWVPHCIDWCFIPQSVRHIFCERFIYIKLHTGGTQKLNVSGGFYFPKQFAIVAIAVTQWHSCHSTLLRP